MCIRDSFDADAQAIYSLNLGEIDKRDILSVGEDEIPEMCIRDRSYTNKQMEDKIIQLLEQWQKKREKSMER